ncbi:contractile injection system tape measure protein [Tenacibaculum amylolyticum]|uniref:contractile injection system tape measure protein n=1 Tax=Tenacibaculum amylolyticum TaxID=104269 RepID=UPI0038949B9A
MINSQEHIIQKVFVEIQTNSKQTAHELKNTIELFLQEEVFPEIENYLDSEKYGSEEMLQISNMTLDIDLDTQCFNFHTSKEEIKEKLVTQLREKLEKPENHDVTVETKSVIKSKTDTFFYFLEHGELPWWADNEHLVEFSKELLFEITETTTFENRFIKSLQEKRTRERLLNQFFNDELQLLFLGIYQKPKYYKEVLSVLAKKNNLSKAIRKKVWTVFIEEVLQKQFSTLPEVITKTLLVIKEDEDLTAKEIAGLETKLLEINTLTKNKRITQEIEINSNGQKNIELTDGEFIAKSNEPNVVENNTETLKTKDVTSTLEDKKASNLSSEASELNEEISSPATKKINQEDHTKSNTLKEGIVKRDGTKSTESEVTNTSLKSDTTEQTTAELAEVISNNESLDKNKTTAEVVEQNKEEIASQKEKLISKKDENKDSLEKQTEYQESIESSVITDKTKAKKGDAKRNQGDLPNGTKKEIDKKALSNEETVIQNSKEKEPQENSENNQVKQEDKLTLNNQGSNNENTAESFIEQSKETSAELIKNLNKHERKVRKTEENSTEDIEKKATQNKRTLERESTKNKKQQNETISKNELKEVLKNRTQEVTQQPFKKVIKQPSKAFFIRNAGLILIHPYLKQFFKACDFLDEDDTIIDPELAAHVLHYIATKKEQQIESNLVFEKFLCNIPIDHPIERDIELTDEIKAKAEELVAAVTRNWEVLKDSSPDLIRNEFIQRSGKLDLTEDNPKLTVERKTQDILLDKLPWNISLCRLPWIEHLIFTDW